MNNGELIPHLFRTEYRKIVAVLCKRFGFGQIETAEDIASDTFLTAAQSWGVEGIPENPAAWLYEVAKNKAKNQLQRNSLFAGKIAPEIRRDSQGQAKTGTDLSGNDFSGIDLSPQNIGDSQLQMMFAICHPCIPSEAQVGLSLRILCGFGIGEVAAAFLTNKETINKRLFRAKERLREEGIRIEMPAPAEMDERLDAVLMTIYLLFNEGYYSVSQDTTLRRDLCLEAMRLCRMLVENEGTGRPAVHALLSLMCFHASRFDARMNESGELILYAEQDTGLWNNNLIARGGYYLSRAASGASISRYHLEAEIAYWSTEKADTREKWEKILQAYNRLLQIAYSPVAALNRTYALSKANGKTAAIREAEKLRLTDNQFYFALLGELSTDLDDRKAKQYFQQALSLAKTQTDRHALQKKIDRL